MSRIKCAAIIHNGVIYEGRAHAEIGWKMQDDGVCGRPFPGGEFQGFATDDGRYVGRIEAMHIAIEAGQVEIGNTCNPRDLYSEDLIYSKTFDYPYKERYVKKKDSDVRS